MKCPGSAERSGLSGQSASVIRPPARHMSTPSTAAASPQYGAASCRHFIRNLVGKHVINHIAYTRGRCCRSTQRHSYNSKLSIHLEIDEGPSAAVLVCEHKMGYRDGSATCFVYDCTSHLFHFLCRQCELPPVCRGCSTVTYRQRKVFHRRYPWPGSDSFDLETMFEVAEEADKAPTKAPTRGSEKVQNG